MCQIVLDKAKLVLQAACLKKWRLVTVESCTGGLIVGALTEIAGASNVIEGGFVTYANALKMSAVGVPQDILAQYGAVSQEVAIAMAQGGLRATTADLAISVTGIAGPGGATSLKPIGLVHFAVARIGEPSVARIMHFGDLGRGQVRHAAVVFALDFMLDCLMQEKNQKHF